MSSAKVDQEGVPDMKMNLNELEIRVLGCLLEKELSTPENYPLSLNALLSACNQKSNRDPVMALTEAEIVAVLQSLGSRGLARLTTTGGRVGKYCHSADKLGLAPEARAILAELMLRGPQTVAELRSRCERMTQFADLAQVEEALLQLQRCGPPLVARLPRQGGRKEQRYAQLFAGLPDFPEEEESAVERVAAPRPAGSERLVRLEEGVGALRGDISLLRQEVEELLALFS
jgi:uncharacterized protein YceH (UPF0502 family)